MRAILVFALLLLGLSSAEPEPDYAARDDGSVHLLQGAAAPSLVDVETSTQRADRLSVAMLTPKSLPVEIFRRGDADIAPSTPNAGAATSPADGANDKTEDGDQKPKVSLDQLCSVVLVSAMANDLPVPFLANLLWQESGLQNNIVSSKGALGIAQFMPETAAEHGLDDPFDPLKAIPASARLLNELRLEFGNLGFVAAAYNAGPGRVIAWLEHRRDLPQETRDYVVQVTGRSAETWRTTPPDATALKFVRRLPCRNMPAFASLEQAQLEQAQSLPPEPEPKLEPKSKPEPKSRPEPVAATEVHKHDAHARIAHDRTGPDRAARGHAARERLAHDDGATLRPTAARGSRDTVKEVRDSRAGRREAAHAPRGAREKHRSA